MDNPGHLHAFAEPGGVSLPTLLARGQHLHLQLQQQQEQQQHHVGSVWERHSNLQLSCMVLSIFFWFFSFTAAFSAIVISRSRYSRPQKRSKSSRLPKEEAPGVSIIRPLRGIDCNMYDNLASSFRQDYPRFEIIFSVAQANDPAIAVVQDLMNEFPKVDARLVIGERNVGINPKINNMIRSYESAKYDILWVLDSNVYVDPGCMGRSVDKMLQPGVGLVHHLPFGAQPQALGSDLELMFLNTVHAKMYLFINCTGLASCVVGKSNLYRRSDLEKCGGLAKFGKYMAEDNLIATEIFNMGYKHEMTSDLAYQSLGSMTPSDYFLRRARWTRIRKYTVTAATVVEPFIEMIGCGLVASYGFNLLWQTHFLNFLAFHIVIWFLIDLSMYQALSGENVDNLRRFLMAWSLRELAALPLYAYAVGGSTVDWRDQPFRLLRDGTVQPLRVPSHAAGVSSDIGSITTIPPVSSASGSRSGAGASGTTATASRTSSPTSPTSPSSAAAFANLASTVVPQATLNSLHNFFQRPAVISVVSSTFAVVHFVVDILIKSQRNGNYEDGNLPDNDRDNLEAPFFAEEQNAVMEKDQRHQRNNKDASVLKLRQAPTTRLHRQQGSSTKHRATWDTPDESGLLEHEFVPRRSARIKSMQSATLSFSSSSSASSSSSSSTASTKARGIGCETQESTDHDYLSEDLDGAVEPFSTDL